MYKSKSSRWVQRRTTAIYVIALISLLTIGNGCHARKGGFVRRNESMFLTRGHPDKFRFNPDSTVGIKYGTYPGLFGEEIKPFGFFEDGRSMRRSYLIYIKPDSFYVNDALSYDDLVYSYRTGPSVIASLSEDPTMWGHAVEYISKRSGRPIEIASDNLIESERSRDSISTGYIVTRILEGDHVVYQISAFSNSRSFNEKLAVRRLGFYMITGYPHREYGD